MKGNESIRLASTKLFIGIQAGGLIARLRESTACIRSFLLIAALKACSYEEREIADILYQFMVTTGLLNVTAVALRQLQDLVRGLSGHTETLLELVLQRNMEVVDVLLATNTSFSCAQFHWQKIPEKDLGKLLDHAFDAVQCDDYNLTELYGSLGLIRLANILLWLSPADVVLFCAQQCILGSKTGKVKIFCGNASLQINRAKPGWATKSWKAMKSTTSVIKGGIDNEEFIAPHLVVNKIPTGSTRLFYADFFVTSAKLDEIGGLAAGVLDCILDIEYAVPNYSIHKTTSEQEITRQRSTRKMLKKLYSNVFLQSASDSGDLWQRHGWKNDNISKLP